MDRTDDDDSWQWDINGWDLRSALAVELEHAVDDLGFRLSAYLYDQDESDGWEPPSGYPYCGCTTCDTRESLVVIVPLVAQAALDGRIRPTQFHTTLESP